MKTTLFLLSLGAAFALSACSGDEQRDESDTHSEGYGEQLGTVQLETSCSEEATEHLTRGLALLHHMTYDGAEEAFAAAAETDPECAIAYWGQAMSVIHPLWSDPPDEETFERGRVLVEEARVRGDKTEKEEAWVSALEAYFAEPIGESEAPNLERFAAGWATAEEAHPDDPETRALRALTLLSTADPEDKTYATQLEAGALAESVLEIIPDHPGGHHYTIHAYDYPPLAEQALEVARSYGNIAPAVPHALHMPSHIFTRLGFWQESIDWNQRSADAAATHSADDTHSLHYLHAYDYVVYAHLQRGEDDLAEEAGQTISNLDGPVQTHLASAYTLAAVPARLALERQNWQEAESLRVPDYPWQDAPAASAIVWFARAIGAARNGNAETARSAIDSLRVLENDVGGYWGDQITIQRLSSEAWLAFAEGNTDEALTTMREAAEREAATEKHPVTPGEVLPAHELLGDLLVEMGRYDEAIVAYDAALERSPNRLNSLYGAGRAAELAGDDATATAYFETLIEVTEGVESNRERLAEARRFLANRET